MAAIDDALNEASIVYGPHQISAYWRESDRDGDGTENADTPTDLTTQFNGDMTVSHSLDDALPDPVTRTGNADAAGVLSAGMNGREGLVLGSSGQRLYDGAGGSWDSAAATTTITAPIPTGSIRDDFIVACVLVNDDTASLAQVTDDPKDNWDFLGRVDDSPLSMYVYGKRRWRTGNPQLTLISDKAVSFMSLSISFWARNPTLMAMDYRVTNVQLVAESASVTSHSVSSTLSNRGYQLAFWGSATVGGITPSAPLTLHGAPAANGLVVAGGISSLIESGVYTATATQSPANAVMCMASLSVEPYERPKMDARQYFSPFNVDSPVYGWDRDTADVLAAIRVLTSSGAVDTAVFDGQMQGIPVSGREATLNAVSKTRISLNRSLTLPMVNGTREGCTTDWLATYLMARGGSFVGPAPNRYTRYWAPCYGSIHAHWGVPQDYNAAFLRDSINPMLLFGLKNPTVVDGPWATAMYAQQTATRQEELLFIPSHLHELSVDDFPHLWDNGLGGPVMADLLSQSNNRGRLMVWLRGDPVQSAPSYMASGDDFIFRHRIGISRAGIAIHGWVEVGVRSSDRVGYIRMGNDTTGYTTVTYGASALPTDGTWHFYGFHWDFALGYGNVCYDGTIQVSSAFASAGDNDPSELPLTDEIGRGSGYDLTYNTKSHVPISDLLVDFGEVYVAGQWSEHYPNPKAPGANATYRVTNYPIAAIAESSAVNAWDTLADLARSTLAAYRCDETDAYNFLTLEYFGETAQMTPVVVQDTTKNVSSLDIEVDPRTIRNVVTVQFPDTRVDTQIQPVLQYLTSLPLPKGITEITFPLDVPVAELHGQNLMSGSAWEVVNLTSSQITTPSLPKTNHFITINTASEGTGTVLPATSVNASIIAWDAMSVTVRFTNFTGTTTYLANNGDQVPFMQVLGYGVRISDAYTTMRDGDSVALRRERGLTAEMPWLQNRASAEEIALLLLNITTHPTALMKVTVMGDPRRKPGQLVTVVDKEGTQADGTWRILSIDHQVSGPKYTQDMLLVSVGPVQVWDDPSTPWDFSVWGE